MSKSGFTRLQIWRHNGHFGRVAMMRQNLYNIISSDTATEDSKKIASRMLEDVHDLHNSLKTRTSPCKPSPDANI
jgi:hypothetical protein